MDVMQVESDVRHEKRPEKWAVQHTKRMKRYWIENEAGDVIAVIEPWMTGVTPYLNLPDGEKPTPAQLDAVLARHARMLAAAPEMSRLLALAVEIIKPLPGDKSDLWTEELAEMQTVLDKVNGIGEAAIG